MGDIPGIRFQSSQSARYSIENFQEFISRRDVLVEEARSQGNNPYAANAEDNIDKAYNYVNTNSVNNQPADIYLTHRTPSVTNRENSSVFTKSVMPGQAPVSDNNVPAENSLIAYLTNNNANTTLTVNNTTSEDLSERFFNAVDNITEITDEGVRTQVNGDEVEILAENTAEGQSNAWTSPNDGYDINPGDNQLSKGELKAAMYSYIFDAQAYGQGQEDRQSSASTVDYDRNSDEYEKFFDKVAGEDGFVTQEELKEGIDAISEESENGLVFNKELMEAYLNGE